MEDEHPAYPFDGARPGLPFLTPVDKHKNIKQHKQYGTKII